MAYDVYGVGNALVDIQATVTTAIVQKLGFEKGIMTLVDEATQEKVLADLRGAAMNRCAGGSAANTIMGIADLGGTAAYAGKVAADEIGEFFLKDMRDLGVAIEVPPGEGQSGTCLVMITEDAERTMLTNLAVSATLSPEDINVEHLQQAKYVYVEGYLFSGGPTHEAALAAIKLAKEHDVKVALTVSDPFLIQSHRDEFLSLIEGPVDLLFCNLDEARALTGKEDPVDCAQEIHQHAENVAMTMGPNGSILMHEGEAIAIEGVSVNAIDTTGAGDMYAAGVLYGITNDLTWKQAGHLASHSAARIVAQMGARLSQRLTKEEVDGIVAEA